MSKPKTLHVEDTDGQFVKGWTFYKDQGLNVGNGKPRRITGWTLKDPDGYERFREGIWASFVPYVEMILANHGYTVRIS